MNLDLYYLSRGPLFKFAFLFFIFGMTYRLLFVLFLGWKKDYAPARGSALRGLMKELVNHIWPSSARRDVYARRMLALLAGFCFHVGAFIVILFQPAHVKVWGEILGFEWPSFPMGVVDFGASVAITSLLVIVVNQLTHPVRKLTTTPSQWVNIFFALLPLLTGWMTYHHLWLPYQTLLTLHMLAVDWLLIWMPLSKLSHVLYFVINFFNHGIKFGKMGTL